MLACLAAGDDCWLFIREQPQAHGLVDDCCHLHLVVPGSTVLVCGVCCPRPQLVSEHCYFPGSASYVLYVCSYFSSSMVIGCRSLGVRSKFRLHVCTSVVVWSLAVNLEPCQTFDYPTNAAQLYRRRCRGNNIITQWRSDPL